jgi:seryl-tRNA synthetase
MLDLADFVSDRGGNPNKIKESQRKRFAPENVVDEVITLYEEARRARYEVMQIGSELNALQKEIGKRKKVCC